MKRRDLIKLFALFGAIRNWFRPPPVLAQAPVLARFSSAWRDWPDMLWTGPDYWANRLQDWRLAGGHAECLVAGRNRTLHCLTHRLGPARESFEVQVTVQRVAPSDRNSATDCLGLRLGAKGPRDDYRSAAVYGNGLDVGLTGEGRLRIGELVGTASVAVGASAVRLQVMAEPDGSTYQFTLSAFDPDSARNLGTLRADSVPATSLEGNVALLSHVDSADRDATPAAAVRFADWQMTGAKIVRDDAATFGPVCFAQYTLHRGTLKLTAQLTPIEAVPGHRISVDVRDGDSWRTIAEPAIDPLSRTVQARAEGWPSNRAVPYRVRVVLPLAGGSQTFDYEGTIAREPTDRDQLRLAVFSCNADYGFPDADVVVNVRSQRVDAAVFLGDQFYESQGGFGIQRAPLEKSSLDVLRKWYMFGWSYRDLFRHIPSAMIPDDHDVYHGNIWGEGGVAAPTNQGWGYVAQDQGGYKMPAAWVNLVQRAQTSHLPDPWDPTPVAQGIGVYYTHWNYAGVSFAILEDRKFKSAPSHLLPASARVINGFATDPAFDHRQHRDLPGATLLGARQEEFLTDWTADRSQRAVFKVVLSQTPFCTATTLPAGSTSDEADPTLPIPRPGEYVTGDAPAGDMDSNGWPANRRDEALRLLRTAGAFHIAGDQHLASVIQYGIDDFGDASFVFTGPALNNLWPRRWWPTVPPGHESLPGAPRYTGNFEDAFGNRMTVHAVANPRITGRQPAIIHNRATGYGVMVFDKVRRTIRIECWPRGIDPTQDPGGQYEGWPVTIRQEGSRWMRVEG